MKKIVAILLVVALMSAMFVVPAHAHEVEEGASTYAYACYGCGARLTNPYTRQLSYTWVDVPNCTNSVSAHKHKKILMESYYVCSMCAYSARQYTTTYYTYECPSA